MTPKPPSSNWKRWLAGIGLAAAIVVLAVLAVIWSWTNTQIQERFDRALDHQRQEVANNIDFFCEQQEKLASDPWFHEPRTEGDAGPLLNVWLPWEPERKTPKDSPLALPDGLTVPNKDWLSASVDVSSLDFSWMRRLQGYDRWDFLESPPSEPRKPLDWGKGSIPYLGALQVWAKLRLLQGLRSGQPLEAARDVRHMAWIVYRMDTTIGGVFAAVLLETEREAHDSMREPPPEWRPMSREQTDRMKALVMSSSLFESIAAPPEVARRARRCGEPAVTHCIGMGEAAFLAKLVKPIAEDDDAFRKGYAAFKEDLAASSCATSTLHAVWERGLTVDDPQAADKPTQSEKLFTRALEGSTLAKIVIARAQEQLGLKRLQSFRESLEKNR